MYTYILGMSIHLQGLLTTPKRFRGGKVSSASSRISAPPRAVPSMKEAWRHWDGGTVAVGLAYWKWWSGACIVCVYIYICIYLYTCIHNIRMYIYIYICTHTYIDICIYIYVWLNLHIYTCTFGCIHIARKYDSYKICTCSWGVTWRGRFWEDTWI